MAYAFPFQMTLYQIRWILLPTSSAITAPSTVHRVHLSSLTTPPDFWNGTLVSI